MRQHPTSWIRPVSLLRLSLLRLFDSKLLMDMIIPTLKNEDLVLVGDACHKTGHRIAYRSIVLP